MKMPPPLKRPKTSSKRSAAHTGNDTPHGATRPSRSMGSALGNVGNYLKRQFKMKTKS